MLTAALERALLHNFRGLQISEPVARNNLTVSGTTSPFSRVVGPALLCDSPAPPAGLVHRSKRGARLYNALSFSESQCFSRLSPHGFTEGAEERRVVDEGTARKSRKSEKPIIWYKTKKGSLFHMEKGCFFADEIHDEEDFMNLEPCFHCCYTYILNSSYR